MTNTTLRAMTAEVRDVNTALGWRTGGNTFGDYIALLHSELGEALEAYRDHRLADVTGPATPLYAAEEDHMGNYQQQGWRPGKPEGVGSEFADVLIRLLDMCDLYEIILFDMDLELADVAPVDSETIDTPEDLETFGDFIAWLHRCVDRFWQTRHGPFMLRALVTVAERFSVNLTAEYVRKIAYNRTRPYQHGGRTLSERPGEQMARATNR